MRLQFFDKKRIDEIYDLQFEYLTRKQAALSSIKDLRNKEAKVLTHSLAHFSRCSHHHDDVYGDNSLCVCCIVNS